MKSMYVEAIRIAIAQPGAKISMNSLTNELKKIGYKVESDRTQYFAFWYYSSFFHSELTPTTRNGTAGDQLPTFISYHAPDVPHELTAEAWKLFIDHENLMQARKSARFATWVSIVAIIISVIVGIIPIIFK